MLSLLKRLVHWQYPLLLEDKRTWKLTYGHLNAGWPKWHKERY